MSSTDVATNPAEEPAYSPLTEADRVRLRELCATPTLDNAMLRAVLDLGVELHLADGRVFRAEDVQEAVEGATWC